MEKLNINDKLEIIIEDIDGVFTGTVENINGDTIKLKLNTPIEYIEFNQLYNKIKYRKI